MYILDTNVLLFDPDSLFQFEDNDILLTHGILKELDSFKSGQETENRNAREVIRTLDTLRNKGDLSEGVKLPGEGSVRIVPPSPEKDTVDESLMSVARNHGATLVTNDVNLRIMADTRGVDVEDYRAKSFDSIQKDTKTINLNEEQTQTLRDGDVLNLDSLEVNEHAILRTHDRAQIHLARSLEGGHCKIIDDQIAYGIQPLNVEQSFALDVLMDPEISLVVLTGRAGTGKTLCSLAAGLSQCLEAEKPLYERVVVSRPIIPVGRDLGYLPGDAEEKMDPWMKPIYDNLDIITKNHHKQGGGARRDFNDFGLLEVEPLPYIRGRSFPDQFILIDESQNISPHEIKTFITRAGENTKIVLTGDVQQIDHSYLDERSNALSYVIKCMQGLPFFASVHLKKGERSQLAEEAAKRL